MSEAILSAERERRLREIFTTIPYVRLLGIELGELKWGEATLHLPVTHQLQRNNGVIHGGAVASLVDSAAAFAILTILQPEETTTTIDLTIHFLRPLLEGRATARAHIVRAGRRVAVVSIDVFDDTEIVVATALTSFIRR